MINIIGWFVLALGLILCFSAQYQIRHQKQRDKKVEEENKELLKTYNDLIIKEKDLINKINLLNQQEQMTKNKINEMNQITENMNNIATSAFEQYIDTLEQSYKQKEEEFEKEITLLDESYENAHNKIVQDLDKITATRAAAIAAQLNEERIKKEKEFYSIHLSALELNDVKILRKIENQLNNPRVLRMLIWQTFYRDQMNVLCNNILGPTIVTGIYKITNQNNNMCYIGQAVDVTKRWKEHAKCGLGIDAPVSNQLYAAMQDEGLENFTWELLEKCSSAELNEKEKFYIELYQSKEYGYNYTKGNKT